MNVLNKLAEFVGKNLTYIVVAVVVAAFFQPQAFTWAFQNGAFAFGNHVRHGHDAARQRFCACVPAS